MNKTVMTPNNSSDVESLEKKITNSQSMKDIDSILSKIDKIEDLVAIDNANLLRLNHSGEIRVRIARRAGEILANSPKNKGGRKGSDGSKERIPTYEEQGICAMWASRCQRIHEIPLTIFEMLLAKLKENGEQITDKHFLNAHADLFPSKETTEKTAPQKLRLIKKSGEKIIDPVEMKAQMRYECPNCQYEMTKLHIVKSKEVSEAAA